MSDQAQANINTFFRLICAVCLMSLAIIQYMTWQDYQAAKADARKHAAEAAYAQSMAERQAEIARLEALLF